MMRDCIKNLEFGITEKQVSKCEKTFFLEIRVFLKIKKSIMIRPTDPENKIVP
jgi:hypothetical protein